LGEHPIHKKERLNQESRHFVLNFSASNCIVQLDREVRLRISHLWQEDYVVTNIPSLYPSLKGKVVDLVESIPHVFCRRTSHEDPPLAFVKPAVHHFLGCCRVFFVVAIAAFQVVTLVNDDNAVRYVHLAQKV